MITFHNFFFSSAASLAIIAGVSFLFFQPSIFVFSIYEFILQCYLLQCAVWVGCHGVGGANKLSAHTIIHIATFSGSLKSAQLDC